MRTQFISHIFRGQFEEFKDPAVCNTFKKGLKSFFDGGGVVSKVVNRFFGTFDQTKVRAFKEADIQEAFLNAYENATEEEKPKIEAIFKALYSTSLGELADNDIKALLGGEQIQINAEDGKEEQTNKVILRWLKLRVGRRDIGILGSTNKAANESGSSNPA